METFVVALSIAAFVLLLAPAVLLPLFGGEGTALAPVKSAAERDPRSVARGPVESTLVGERANEDEPIAA
jgi:hypothetical protein